MRSFVIDDVKLILPDGIKNNMSVKIENGRISEISGRGSLKNETVVDGGGLYLSPGFIDIHVHGGGGCDFMDADEDSCRTALLSHMKHGTTSAVPTTLTSEDDELAEVFASIIKVKNAPDSHEYPHVLGIHLEGPYIAESMAGAQDPKYIKKPEPQRWREIVKKACGELLIWTVAPEISGALEMCRELKKEGIIFSAGHSEAKYDDAVRALDAGYTMATHLYSSMSTIIRENGYRVPGLLEAAMLHDEYCAEVIADGKHLPVPLLKLIYKTKGTDRIVLVTDAMRGAGMPDGEYMLGSLSKGQRVFVFDGIAHMPDGISFAGSVATADRLIRVMTKDAGIPLYEAVSMMTCNPAREIGIADKKGTIDVGMDADIVLFDDNISIKSVYVSGEKLV